MSDPEVMTITLAEITEMSRRRCERWHPGFPHAEEWTLSDWSNAMAGEAGEVAEAVLGLLAAVGKSSNVAKKMRRIETGLEGNRGDLYGDLRDALGEELADTVLYAVLVAVKVGIDLDAAIVAKFNLVSEREGWPERLALHPVQDDYRTEMLNRAVLDVRLGEALPEQ